MSSKKPTATVGTTSSRKRTTRPDATKKTAAQPLLKGMCFTMTGTLSEVRAAIKRLIESHGGKTSDSVTSKTTHLIAAAPEAGTIKYDAAQSKGIPIVSEAFLRDLLSTKNPSLDWTAYALEDCPQPVPTLPPQPKKQKTQSAVKNQPKTSAKLPPLKEPAASKDDKKTASSSGIFSRCVFCLVDVPERDVLLPLIRQHGGNLAMNVSNRVTHVVAAASAIEDQHPKVLQAQTALVPVVRSAFVLEAIKQNRLPDVEEHTWFHSASSSSASGLFSGMTFYLIKDLSLPKARFVSLVQKYGGHASPNLAKTTHIISNEQSTLLKTQYVCLYCIFLFYFIFSFHFIYY